MNLRNAYPKIASVGSDPGEDPPRRVRGANGGRMRAARGVRGRGAAPRYRFAIFKVKNFDFLLQGSAMLVVLDFVQLT